jgi:hypothetical protein
LISLSAASQAQGKLPGWKIAADPTGDEAFKPWKGARGEMKVHDARAGGPKR